MRKYKIKKMAAIVDVHKHAPIYPMTVSRVIGNEGCVRQVLLKRGQFVIEQLQYSPNPATRNLADTKQLLICLL